VSYWLCVRKRSHGFDKGLRSLAWGETFFGRFPPLFNNFTRKGLTMLVNGLEIPTYAFEIALNLLSQLIGVDEKALKRATKAGKDDYLTRLIPKGNGDERELDIPNLALRNTQSRLLNGCLYHVEPEHFADWAVLTGFMRGKSICSNATAHLDGRAFLQLDFANAFPSVSTEMVRDALSSLVDYTTTVKRMFRFKDVRWFWKWFKESEAGSCHTLENGVAPIDVLWALREIIIMITMFKGRLPQGAPTSPHLFNLVVASQRIPTIINQALAPFAGSHQFTVTIYADNVTISTTAEKIPQEAPRALIEVIETQTPFRINPGKTHYTLAKQGSPLITGLSIGHKNGEPFLTVRQRVQRMARGFFNSVANNPTPKTCLQAHGLAAFFLDVYDGRLPEQIAKPYRKLLASIRASK